MESFYLTLPCDFNRQQSLAYFNTKLLEDVNLEGTWEVGVSDISFPKTWYNFNRSEDIRLLFFDFTAPHGFRTSIVDDAWVPKNLYTLESLVDSMNNAIQTHFTNDKYLVRNLDIQMKSLPSVNFNRKTNTFVLCKGESKRHGYVYILPSPMLCETIGYDYQEIKVDVQELFEKIYLPFVRSHGDENGVLPNTLHLPNDDITTTPRHPYSIEPVKYLFVMCDLILDKVYGGTRRNILRIVEVPSSKKFGDQISIAYDHPQYIEIRKNNFNKIEIKIRKHMS